MRICPQCRARTEARACPIDGTATLDEAAFTDADPRIGKVFDGRYAVLARIGKGGMGTVYRAKQLSVGRQVALKVLDPDLARDIDMAGRFVREAQLASRLQHPNTIVVHDFGHTSEGLFIAMELLHGETLRDRLNRVGAPPLPEALRIAREVAASLGHAHGQRVIHRDLKPDNVFLHRVGDLEVVKVLDFGIAKVFEGQGPASDEIYETAVAGGERPIIGTYQYMAPEQIEGRPLDARTDVYALGLILYELVAGHRPFQGDTMMAVLRMHLEEPPLPLPDSVPDDLAVLVYALLAKSPDKRPADGDEVARELDRVEEQVLGGRGSDTRIRGRRRPRPERTMVGRTPGALQKPGAARLRGMADLAARRTRRAWVRYQTAMRTALVVALLVGAIGTGAWLLRHRHIEPVTASDAPGATPAPAEAAETLAPANEPEPKPAPPPVALEEPAVPPESDRRAWLRVEAGSFEMGVPDGTPGRQAGEAPVHTVTVSRPLMVRSTEVTQREWQALMGNNPSAHRDCPECPVENVSWYEALAFANALSKHFERTECYRLADCQGTAGEGLRCSDVRFAGIECTGYRLPTEAEWELVAQGGGARGPGEALEAVAWFGQNSGGTTRPVDSKRANPLGVRGMLGNVAEWVWDVYSDRYYEWGPDKDPMGPAMGDTRATRGCGFSSPRERCLPGARRPREPIVLDSALGFRVVRTL